VAEKKTHLRILVWLRRALRVQDNTPLWNAVHDAEELIPAVCLQDSAAYRDDTPRRRFISQSLYDLDRKLTEAGSALIVLAGVPSQAIPAAAQRFGVEAVYAATVYDPVGCAHDTRIRSSLSKQGVRWATFKDIVVCERNEVMTRAGLPFKVFTPFKNAWLERLAQAPGVLPRVRTIRTPRVSSAARLSDMCPLLPPAPEPGGEKAALKRLRDFIAGSVATYRDRRDFLGVDGTSRLSAHLSHGTISIRQVLWAAVEAKESADAKGRQNTDTFISELIWREFYYHILGNFPRVIKGPFREDFDALVWSENKKHFAAWCEGRTGYPVVDAAMRQLASEGWMHNRARMIVASFLTKDLHLSWQWGERYFFEQLMDADIASNNGGWQWTAGTGTDASPWFRIFNPVMQGERFDPDGAYVRRYVPELQRLPSESIHKPWMMSRADQEQYGVVVDKTYPAPIIDHAAEREVTLALYKHPGRTHQRLRHA